MKPKSWIIPDDTASRGSSINIRTGIMNKLRRTIGFPQSFILALVALLVAAVSGVATITNVAAADTQVIPEATYLRTNGDSALDTVPIDIGAAGISGGDCITLKRLGDFAPFSGAGDDFVGLNGVFSSSNVLLAANNLNRVPGAIDAG